jgi:integrase
MPPELVDVLEACPTTKTRRTPGRPPEPDLAGARDRALLLVGFVGAPRRSELVGLDFEHINDHPQGLVVTIPRSKTNQEAPSPISWCCPSDPTRPAATWLPYLAPKPLRPHAPGSPQRATHRP